MKASHTTSCRTPLPHHAALLASLVLVAAPARAGTPKTFSEVGGVIAMEAEHAGTIKGWNEVAGSSGTAMKDASARNKGWMRYSVTFKQAGDFYVYLLCRYSGNSGAEQNDAYVELDGARLYGGDGVTRPEGMLTHSKTLAWTYRPKGPGGDTPANIATDPVYFKVASKGTRTLEIRSRSAGFVIDKVVLIKDGGKAGLPQGTGPAETVSGSPPPADAGPPPPADAAAPPPADAGPPQADAAAPPKILFPPPGAALSQGTRVRLKGTGGGPLSWRYDGHSDGLPEQDLGGGASVDFDVPVGLTGDRTVTILLSGAGGTVEQTHAVVDGAADGSLPAADGQPAAGETHEAGPGPTASDAGPGIDAPSQQPPAPGRTDEGAGPATREGAQGGCGLGGPLAASAPATSMILVALLGWRRRRRSRTSA